MTFVKLLIFLSYLLSPACANSGGKAPKDGAKGAKISKIVSTDNSKELAKEENTNGSKRKKVVKSKSHKKSPKSNSKIDEIQKLKEIVGRYKKSNGISNQVNKSVYNSFTEEEKKSSGKMFFSKGRLKLVIQEPDPYLLLMAKDTIWIENQLNKDLGGGVQVTKLKATDGLKQSNALLAFFFDDLEVWDKFKVKEAKETRRKLKFTLVPIDKKNMGEVTKVYIELGLSSETINKIKYWDELENWTEYNFSKINFEARFKRSFFSYKPPKGVKPTVL